MLAFVESQPVLRTFAVGFLTSRTILTGPPTMLGLPPTKVTPRAPTLKIKAETVANCGLRVLPLNHADIVDVDTPESSRISLNVLPESSCSVRMRSIIGSLSMKL